MKKVSCEVIRDLLPLYVDDAANQETRELVQEHLNTCPYCREELRMMRSLVTLPPGEDTELVLQTFRERQARQRRNKKIAVISAVSAAALIVLFCVSFCLWYVQPRSWDTLTKERDVDNMAASLLQYYFRTYGPYGEIDHGWDVWNMNAEQAEGAALEAVLDELRSGSYRASLKNLVPKSIFPLDGRISSVSYLTLVFIWEAPGKENPTADNDWGSLTVFDNGNVILDAWMTGYHSHLYHTDSGLYERLAPIIQEYGTFRED